MNASQFAQAERANFDRQEARHQRDIAAEESFGRAADAIERELSADAATIADIAADVIFEPDFCNVVAALYAAGRPDHAGRVLTERIATHIKLRAIREAAAREKKAAEEAAAERWLERELSK